jgi:RNA polymerase sigma-70 factor, ECF subfamily
LTFAEATTPPRVDRRRDPATGLQGPRRVGALPLHHYLHAARADLLRRLDAHETAADAYARALELAGNAAERAFLERRLDDLIRP